MSVIAIVIVVTELLVPAFVLFSFFCNCICIVSY